MTCTVLLSLLRLSALQGYSAAYARLSYAARPKRPVLAEIADPKQYLDQSIARVLGAAR
jgi:hypothetical protein